MEAKEDAIIAAAKEEFFEHGFDGARMVNIARRADVAEGTIYLYFKNKNSLLVAVVGAFYDRLTKAAASGVAELPGTTDKLAFLARHHLEYCLVEWGIIEQVAAAYRLVHEYQDSEYIGFNRTYVAIFDDVIRAGVACGDIREDVPLQLIRDLFYGALEYTARTHMIRGYSPRNAKLINETAAHLMAMVTPAIAPDSGPVHSDQSTDLEAVTERLEAVAAQLEAGTGST